MIAKSFRSVGLVAGVAVAALSCYMVSLQVAAERSDVAELEARIVAARQDIRSLQTELGTRGRMQQLERWNAEVLALSAPVSGQYVENEVMLARFDVRQPSFAERTQVQLASADQARPAPQVAAPQVAAPRPTPQPSARPTPQLASAPQASARPTARLASARPAESAGEDRPQQPMVRRAALVDTATPAPRPARAAAERGRQSLVDARVVEEIERAERTERTARRGERTAD